MHLPEIHANGTPKSSLIDGLCKASEALDAAYQALKQTAPNGRDYGPHALSLATAEHLARLRKVGEVKDEVDALTVAIDEL